MKSLGIVDGHLGASSWPHARESPFLAGNSAQNDGATPGIAPSHEQEQFLQVRAVPANRRLFEFLAEIFSGRVDGVQGMDDPMVRTIIAPYYREPRCRSIF